MAVNEGLSVLIPAYNPGPRFRGLIEGIEAQIANYPDTEIIVADDGSTEDISWVFQYPHVRYIRLDHSGEPTTRNVLLDSAVGEFISFVDADDDVSSEYLAIVYDNMLAGYDWVSYDWTCDGRKEWAYQNKGTLMINCAVWAYSFRREFIGGIRFNTSMYTGGDVDWLPRVLRDDCKHYHDHRIYYNYRWMGNDNSICHRKLRGEPLI